VAKILVDTDEAALAEAAEAFGTKPRKDTVNVACITTGTSTR
jgi:Arc/MetJ family transcription regulator